MSAGHELVRLRGGAVSIRSLTFGEVCHPGVGPRMEAEMLYVRGLALERRLAEHAGEFVIWDIGLGGGANAVTAIAAAGAIDCDLRTVSFDATSDTLAFALQHAGELGYFGSLEDAARQLLRDADVAFTHGAARVRWTHCLGDFPSILASPLAAGWPPPHAIFFDPYSPATNPEMWTLPLFSRLFDRLEPDRPCALATYSRSSAVRVALLLAGFFVGAGAGIPPKEETTIAVNRRDLLAHPLDARWLNRAQRSRAAEPWVTSPFVGRPLSEPNWERLRRHPQFADGSA